MKISINWLKQYVSIDIPLSKLADRLTMAGLEVEAVIDRYAHLSNVVVGKILDIRPHPNADNLRLCKVDVGRKTVSVVCGAPNVQKGMKVPCALPGALMPSGLLIEKTRIRGEASEGMLCSELELGLGADGSGILVLASDLTEGSPLAEALPLSDIAFEIGLTPNRPDCLSHIGVAREVAALLNQPLNLPKITLPQGSGRISDLTSVTIEAPELCPRYAARLLTDVRVAPSPAWLQDRLRSVDLKPINNIVDVTNYVMLEFGQPLHAFDFDRLYENRIVVKTAASGDRFTTLDGKERILTDETLMICDGEKPVAIAGVMGGENSEIEEKTTRVLIESAYFNPISIRKTSKHLGLSTDASYRFERGVDPMGTVIALNRAAQLMAEVSGGRLVDGVIDAYPSPTAPPTIRLSVKKTNRHLGTRLSRSKIEGYLCSVGFEVKADGPDTLMVVPPSFRVDVNRPEDLMEEAARLWGYNHIRTTFPRLAPIPGIPQETFQVKEKIRDLMNGFGFIECITYSFISKASCDRLNLSADDEKRRMLEVLNPLTEDQAVMRTSLVPGLLETMRRNLSMQVKNLKIFELGKVFISNGQDQLPDEIEMLAGLWTGSRWNQTWHHKPEPCDFFDLKGVVEGLFDLLDVERFTFTPIPNPSAGYTRPGHEAHIRIGDTCIGRIGEVRPTVLKEYDLKQTAFVFELDIFRLIEHLPKTPIYRPIPRFPSVERDTTLIVDNQVQAGDILEKTKSFQETLMEDICVFDVYRGDPIPKGKKSISFRIVYRSLTETLSDKRVNDIHQTITDRLIQAFDAALPG